MGLYVICKFHLPPLICAHLFAPAHLCPYLLLLFCVDHVPGLVLLRHSGGPGINHLLCLCRNCVIDLLLLHHGGHRRRGCEAFADGVEHLGLVRFKQWEYDGADDMYALALQAN